MTTENVELKQRRAPNYTFSFNSSHLAMLMTSPSTKCSQNFLVDTTECDPKILLGKFP